MGTSVFFVIWSNQRLGFVEVGDSCYDHLCRQVRKILDLEEIVNKTKSALSSQLLRHTTTTPLAPITGRTPFLDRLNIDLTLSNIADGHSVLGRTTNGSSIGYTANTLKSTASKSSELTSPPPSLSTLEQRSAHRTTLHPSIIDTSLPSLTTPSTTAISVNTREECVMSVGRHGNDEETTERQKPLFVTTMSTSFSQTENGSALEPIGSMIFGPGPGPDDKNLFKPGPEPDPMIKIYSNPERTRTRSNKILGSEPNN
ncbi:unnamed protein product [Didymodactylos carnosus]|uniref:Uncharacterized protein n=1 Tax=Didymodactylos carnosus TaxID=1234261 RepID=A0A8S2H0R7_9BILA|nr:unnamed protein product [Didymodactylos carnosus]CAF3577645.1 unnamed protein product [Didymodactylos carnosus]